MWILRRLKALGCPIPELLDVLRQQILSICEGNVAYWGPMITKEESNMLERCFKTGLHIIYQEKYITFSQVLKLANMQSLKTRRVALITSFSKKAFRHNTFKKGFGESEARTVGARTRDKPIPRLKTVAWRTQRYKRLSLPWWPSCSTGTHHWDTLDWTWPKDPIIVLCIMFHPSFSVLIIVAGTVWLQNVASTAAQSHKNWHLQPLDLNYTVHIYT